MGGMRFQLAARGILAGVLLAAWWAAPTGAQQLRRTTFRAVNYDVQATITPADQMLEARVRMDLQANEGSRIIEVELHPALKLNSVSTADGKPLVFDRDPDVPLRVRITLNDAVPAGTRVALNLQYAGVLSSEESSPVKDVRLAYIGSGESYLLQPARWFPLTDFPGGRYTGTFTLSVPKDLGVAGTGKAISAPTPAPNPPAPKGQAPAMPSLARTAYAFRCDHAGTCGSFIIGKLNVQPVRVEGRTIEVYLPADGGPENAAQYAQLAAGAESFFSSQFGPLPDASLSLAMLPDSTLPAFTAPGTIFLSKRQWTSQPNTRLLARLVAQLWWGDAVQAATPDDAWITDGLARYCEALYAGQEGNAELFNRALEDFAVGALSFEDAAPIAQAGRLAPYSPEYNSVVVNKGALVFNMLRAQIGEKAFDAGLREFYAAYAGKAARIADLQKIMQTRLDEIKVEDKLVSDLGPFFANWVSSTGLPEFKVEYVVQRIRKGFRVIGKITQPLETFRMPVEVRVLTDGNPETRVVDVAGTSADFVIDTFGRPKPNGVQLDPNNRILKSSPKLRVRSFIARGEELAQQGRLYDAVMEYQRALDLQPNSSLASFRIGESLFYQKNYQASANAFRDALDGDFSGTKWIEVWSHIYLGKIFDISGQRDRAVNEYRKAQDLADNTGGAQDEVEKLMKEPFKLPG